MQCYFKLLVKLILLENILLAKKVFIIIYSHEKKFILLFEKN